MQRVGSNVVVSNVKLMIVDFVLSLICANFDKDESSAKTPYFSLQLD